MRGGDVLKSIDRALPWLVGVTCAGLLASWIPHYVTWPWFRDLDAFATMAQAWDAGSTPYRDIRAYNFPGQIYVLWILGKTVGWGHTAPFYVVDVVLLLALSATLRAWSARRFGTTLPGLVACLWFLGRYLNLDYSQVAQRDWQATCLVAMALLVLQSVPRGGRTSSALLAAAAFAFRPHVLLFLPALASAVRENTADAAKGDGGHREAARSIGAWFVVFLMGVTCAFAPLVIAGTFPDFVRNLRIAGYGGPYSQNSPSRAIAALVAQLASGWTVCLIVVAFLLAVVGPPQLRRCSRTWSLALFAALLYKPLHPVQHGYLQRPLELVESVVAGLAVAWIIQARALPRWVPLASSVAVLLAAMPAIPQYCDVRESLRAVRQLWRGTGPDRPPPGARTWFSSGARAEPYSWTDYQELLRYLRESTGAETLVANVLRRFPFPPVNAPAGRLSPFMVESGICWMWLVDEDLDARFAVELERAPDSVVVWIPNEPQVDPRMQLEQLTATIRRLYRPHARFGHIEVWRRSVLTSSSWPTGLR